MEMDKQQFTFKIRMEGTERKGMPPAAFVWMLLFLKRHNNQPSMTGRKD
jgi:hypothetical protein